MTTPVDQHSTAYSLYQPCYFSVKRTSTSTSSSSTSESCSPDLTTPYSSSTPSSNPLLTGWFDDTPQFISPYTMNASNFMQLQSHAAHNGTRPQPHPVQNLHQDVLDLSNDGSDSSNSDSSLASSSSEQSFSTTPNSLPARCSRCQRTPSQDLTFGRPSAMLQYGLNLFYCTRCAHIVGLGGHR